MKGREDLYSDRYLKIIKFLLDRFLTKTAKTTWRPRETFQFLDKV